MTDYTNGRYNVFKESGPLQVLIGRIDHEKFVRSNSDEMLYRIVGLEVYEVGGGYVGEIDEVGDGQAMVVSRQQVAILTIVPE